MSDAVAGYGDRVFLNVPFDRRYRKLFDALVFTIFDCGFVARCALEIGDGSEVRLDKILRIIGECRYGVHDLSRVTLDAASRLPRFNMPLELGIFLGAKRFGDRHQRTKSALILERDAYRYRVYCSDISGQDIQIHNDQVDDAILAVRDWLRAARRAQIAIPGAIRIGERYVAFKKQLPEQCRPVGLNPSTLTFVDYRNALVGWLRENPR